MATLFGRETLVATAQITDPGRLRELDHHELLQDDQYAQIASFDHVRAMGALFLNQEWNDVIPSGSSLPSTLPPTSFWGKLALGTTSDDHYPVTAEVVASGGGCDLLLHIVPIHFAALSRAQHGSLTDRLLSLAAAAAVAPQFLRDLRGGIETTVCASKKEIVSSITPDHGTPLVVAFDTFSQQHNVLHALSVQTGNPALTIRQAAHLHGRKQPEAAQISNAASSTGIAGGVSVRSIMRRALPRHALYVTSSGDGEGHKHIVTIDEALQQSADQMIGLSLLAAALGFTARVVGNSDREKTIEKILNPVSVDDPLQAILSP